MSAPQIPDRRPVVVLRTYPTNDDFAWPDPTPSIPTLILGMLGVLGGLAVLAHVRGIDVVGLVGDVLGRLLLGAALGVLALVATPLVIVGVLVLAVAHLLGGCGYGDMYHGRRDRGDHHHHHGHHHHHPGGF